MPLEEPEVNLEETKKKFQEFVDDEETLNLLSSIFKVMGDPTRLKIIFALNQSTLNVSQLVELLDMSQSSISHQLSLLRHENLIKFEKVGRKVYYSLDDDHVISLFDEGYEHAKHKKEEFSNKK